MINLKTALRITLSFLALVSAAVLFIPVSLKADDTVKWARVDFPPFEISSGPFKNSGIVDIIKKRVQSELRNYSHVDAELMNFERLTIRLKRENICHSAVIRSPETEKLSYMSVAVGMIPSYVLIVSAVNREEKFGHQKMVSLHQVVEKGFNLGVPARLMGPVVAPIIEKYKDRSNVYIRKQPKITGLFKMLAQKRIDCIIGFPAEAVFWNKMNSEYRLAVIPLKETFGQYTIGRVCCSKNEWGRKIIEETNGILLKFRMTDAYISDVLLPWIPENIKEVYLRDYNRIISEDSWSNIY